MMDTINQLVLPVALGSTWMLCLLTYRLVVKIYFLVGGTK
jgi:hypothetical protein